MKDFDSATAAYYASGAGVVAARLVYIQAVSRSTGNLEGFGVWSGLTDRNFSLSGVTRQFSGAGQLLSAEPITAAPGVSVRTYRVGLSAVAPEVEDLIKGYHTRGARAEVYRALFDPQTRALVAEPRRVFLGRISEVDFPDAVPGGKASVDLSLMSEAHALTRSLAAVKSFVQQKLRGGDGLRRYADVSGSVAVYWGERRET